MHKKSFFIKDILTGPHPNDSLSLINNDHQTSQLYHPKLDLNSFNLSTSVYSSVSLWPSFNTVSCISCIHPISSSTCSVNWSTVTNGTDAGEQASGSSLSSNATTAITASNSNNRKVRRNRTVFTELQLMGLERRFDSQKYLSTPDRAELARALGLTQLQVKTWYQVMQGGCPIPPTKPKGRPKKNSIPSLGMTLETALLANDSSGLLSEKANTLHSLIQSNHHN